MFSKYLKTLSILKKFLFINFIIFTIIGLFTLIYLNNIEPSLLKKKSEDHINIINNTTDNIKRLNIKFEENGHNWDKISSSKEIVISPGISSNKIIKNIPLFDKKNIISEIEFASRYTNSFLIAVTGSNGKTTTSYLIYHILKSSGFNVGIAGNMGKSFSESISDSQFEYYVLEVSSFQLDDIVKFKPDISIITNISEDHLDRYNLSLIHISEPTRP